jgi:phosphatidylglycerophosphate synthase
MEYVLTSIGSACLASLFVVYFRRRASYTKQARSRGQMLPAIVFDFGHWLLGTVVPLLRHLRMTPNLLSFLSVPTSVLAALFIAAGHFLPGGALLIASFSLDAWDGALARALGIASDAGEAVDAMIDRYNDVIVMMGFLYYFRAELLSWLIAAGALIGTVAVSYSRAKGAALGVDPVLGCMQRHERAVWLALATVVAPAVATFMEQPSRHPAYYVVVVALAAVAIGTNVTAIRRAQFIVATLEERQRRLAA